MASYAGNKQTFQQKQQQQHNQYQAQNMRNDSLSILAQAKPAIISSNGGVSVAANGYFNGCSLEDSDKSITVSAVSDHNHRLHNNNHHQRSISYLSGKLNNVLKNSIESSRASDDSTKRLNATHIEDENVIHKQNASNQMRQAAVQAAVASQQQKVRLSATERLAMTAKKPQQQQVPVSSNPTKKTATSTTNCTASKPSELELKTNHLESSVSQQKGILNSKSPQNAKSAPMPTLETLLAVQRQLQQHTRQNLTSVARDPIKEKQRQQPSCTLESLGTQLKQHLASNNNGNLQIGSIGTLSNGFATNGSTITSQYSSEAYEKDLPPLPDSASPSTLTDDSQLNSLESQSSPATSLVSIPPPPPPLSTYLQQYDETNSHTRSSSSTSSTPSTTCSSDMSSVRQFPGVMPPKQPAHQPLERDAASNNNNKALSTSNLRRDLSAQTKPSMPPPPPPPLAPKPTHLDIKKITSNTVAKPNHQRPENNGAPESLSTHSPSRACASVPIQKQQHNDKKTSFQQPPQTARDAAIAKSELVNSSISKPTAQQTICDTNDKRQIDYRQHMFHPETSITISKCNVRDEYSGNELKRNNDKRETPLLPSSFSAPHLLPLPPSMLEPEVDKLNLSTCAPVATSSFGFDEPDCGSFRFPTPPPPDMLLDEIGYEVDSYDKKSTAKASRTVNLTKQSDQDSNDCDVDDVQHDGDYENDDDDDEDDEDDNEDEDDDDDDDEDEDEDFQCKIPTPPPHKSMSAATFQSLVDCLPASSGNPIQTGPASSTSSSLFSASTFSVPTLANNIPEKQNAKSTINESSPTFSTSSCTVTSLQPPPLFRQQKLPQEPPHNRPSQQQPQQQQQQRQQQQQLQSAQLTVHINTDGNPANTTGLLATSHSASAGANRIHSGAIQNDHNLNQNHHHHMIMALTASSSSPSSSSDGDGQSSNSSSSTSGIHSSIDSPSSNSKLDDFNYGGLATDANVHLHQPRALDSQSRDHIRATSTATTTKLMQQLSYQQHLTQLQQPPSSARTTTAQTHQMSRVVANHQQQQQQNNNPNARLHTKTPSTTSALLAASKAHAAASRMSSSMAPPSSSPVTSIPPVATTLLRKTSISSTSSLQSLGSVTSVPGLPVAPANAVATRRPALKQKKTVSFSDKVELVACAEEQCDDHLPNPLLARVLAGKLQ